MVISYEIESSTVLSFTVEGIPVAQPRARHARAGNNVRTYYPASHPIGNWKNMVIIAVREAFARAALTLQIDCPVFVRAEFVFPMVTTTKMLQKTSKPDCDNLVKGLLDGINNSGVWRDDSIVCSMHGIKRYAKDGELACTKVEIALIEPILVSKRRTGLKGRSEKSP
jgi:Holliday junction resolvase RusA-like endonuclease